MPKIIDDNLVLGEILFEWEVKEFENYQRNSIWYILMLGLGLFLVGYGIFTGNFLFALIIVLIAIILFLQSQQDAPSLPFAITELGVIINNRFYSYSELENFYIIYNPPEVKTLFFETTSLTRPRLVIPLDDEVDPNEIRHTLREYLVEDLEKEEEPFSEMFRRKWQIH